MADGRSIEKFGERRGAIWGSGAGGSIRSLGFRDRGCGSTDNLDRGGVGPNGDDGGGAMGTGSDEGVSESDGGDGAQEGEDGGEKEVRSLGAGLRVQDVV